MKRWSGIVAVAVMVAAGGVVRGDEDFTPGQVPTQATGHVAATQPSAARVPDFAQRPKDESDDVLAKVNPPARFKAYKPQFAVRKQAFTFNHVNGPRTETWRVITDKRQDGDRVVAVISPGGGIHLLAFDPATAPTEEAFAKMMPTGRWHIDTFLGSPLGTDAFIPGDLKTQDASYDFRIDNDAGALTLVRHFKGSRGVKDKKGNHTQRLDVTNAFRLYVHPQTGYSIDGCFDVAVDPKPKAKQYLSATTHKCYDLWPNAAGAHRTLLSKIDLPKGSYTGWYLNMHGIDRCDESKNFAQRDGGFAAYMNEDTLWSAITTTVGGDTNHIPVCNAHADLDLEVKWPEDLKPGADGLYRHVVWHRLFGMPPEGTRYLWDTMDVMYKNDKAVFIKVGELEDFEDQPRPAASRARGMYWTSNPPAIVDGQAHSGTRSMLIKGRAWPNLPQLILEPNSRYRMEAWYKVVNWTDAERAAHKAAWETRKEAEEKKGKTVPPYVAPPSPAEAYLVADFYEWSSHTQKMVKEMRSSRVKGDVDGWQQIVYEFDTPAWDPFCNLAFVVEGGTAYLDDFKIVKVGPATTTATPQPAAEPTKATRDPWGEK